MCDQSTVLELQEMLNMIVRNMRILNLIDSNMRTLNLIDSNKIKLDLKMTFIEPTSLKSCTQFQTISCFKIHDQGKCTLLIIDARSVLRKILLSRREIMKTKTKNNNSLD